ncbi:MAG: ParB/RepB/Spo0J family partition protein [Candidatus Eisenbacteria bacterium]|uniref:ParB/RepB/Spo0J family partition protein n=1 Tax=Eiseniibacteriota bacterium TaxID=2212470 RepID=A0A538T006_UNCEI|nr:MAG: ParB/RepB/Spo0J family partition protein [Candidatus Eisenbacteria bacterium]
MVRKALGRGLASLIPAAVKKEVSVAPELRPVEPRQGEIQHVLLSKVVRNPAQPRTQFDPSTIAELAASIRERGVLQPVLVRPSGGAFQIVAGERRFLAAREAGLETIPAIVRQFTDREALLIALIENVQRENLNPMDEARAYYKLAMEYGLPHDEIGERVGKDRSTVSNILRFNNLPEEIQGLLEAGSITSGHARALLALPSDKAQADLAKSAAAHGWSVRELEERVRRVGTTPSAGRSRKAPKRAFSSELMGLEDDLMRALGTRVRVTRRRGGTGSIFVDYHSEEELDRLVTLLRSLG